MINKYIKDGIGVLGGGLAGVADRIAANMDAKSKAEFVAKNPGKTLPIYQQVGTYVNYLVPLVEVGLVGFEVIKDEFANGVMAGMAGQLAASKVTAYATRKNYVLTYSATPAPWTGERAPQNRYLPQPLMPPVPYEVTAATGILV